MAYEQIKIKSEAGRCLLCQDAPCSRCCPRGLAVADIVRSLRFENETGAARKSGKTNPKDAVHRVWKPVFGAGLIRQLIFQCSFLVSEKRFHRKMG